MNARAEAEWQTFINLGPSDGWTQEAEAAFSQLRSPSRAEVIRSISRALSTLDRQRVRQIVTAHPQDAWNLAEQSLLATWATAAVKGEGAEAVSALAEARVAGEALFSITQDAFVLSLAESAESLSLGDRTALARAYLDFRRGRELYDARQVIEAETELRRAQSTIAELDTVLRPWLEFYVVLCEYWRGDRRSREQLEGLAQQVAGRGLPILEGYLSWMIGLIRIEEGRFSSGLEAYRRGLERFERTSLVDEAAFLRSLIADALVRLGDPNAAWSEMLPAISESQDLRKPRIVWTVWDQAAQLTLLLGRPEVADYFAEEALRGAAGSTNPATLSNAFAAQAHTHLVLGQTSAARRDLRQARHWATKVTDPAARARVEAPLLVAESRATAPGAEEAAIQRLTRAVRRYREIDADVLLPQLLLERARHLVRIGDAATAEKDLRKAISILDDERRAIDDLEWRVSFSNVARPTLDELLWFHLDVSDDLQPLPGLTDLARDPTYFAPLSPVASSELLDMDYLEALRLAPGEALLSVTLVEDRLVLWVLRDGGLSVVTEPAAPKELGRRLTAARERPSLDDLAWFHDRMIGPVASYLEGAERLFLALDRGLNLLPVGALYDRESRTYLTERTAVALVPAALLLAHRPADRQVPVGRVAIVGSAAGEGLPRLPAVEAEAEAIAVLYPERRIELGDLTAQGLEAAGSWADVLQFSGHAISNPLVPGLSRLVSGDEPIYAREIRELRMTRARTVILAACETAATTPEDSSGVLSLAVAFLEAGADWVVASLWPIDDRAARRFTERFHQELRRDPSPDRALRRTQLHLLRSGDVRLEDWAGYQVITG